MLCLYELCYWPISASCTTCLEAIAKNGKAFAQPATTITLSLYAAINHWQPGYRIMDYWGYHIHNLEMVMIMRFAELVELSHMAMLNPLNRRGFFSI